MKCPNCGGENTGSSRFCVFCGGELSQAPAQPQAPVQSQFQSQYQPSQYQYPSQYQAPANAIKENIPMGIIGAVAGSLLGGLAIILLIQLNIVASLSGLVLAFCTLKGYEKLGKKMSNVGIVVSVILMIVVPVVAYFIGCSISVINEVKDYGISIGIGEALDALIQVTKETPGEVIKDLLMLYLFTALGGVGIIASTYKANKK